jgi:hypothetical protein
MQLNVYRFNMRPLLCSLQPTHGCVHRTVPFKAAVCLHDSSLTMHGHVLGTPFLVLKNITSVAEHLGPNSELSAIAAHQPTTLRQIM